MAHIVKFASIGAPEVLEFKGVPNPYHFSSQMSATTPNCKGFRPMKKAMRTLLAAGAFAIGVVPTVQAADITAMTGYAIKLNADSSALVYYTVAPDGFHVVVTTQQGRADRAAVERFETVLAVGQSAAVSVPRHAGEAPARMLLNNAGDRLHIAEPNAAVSVR